MTRRASVALLVVGLLAGCSGDDDGASTASASATASEPAAIVLRLGVEEIGSFDPVEVSPGSQTELLVADLLFDGLTASGPGGIEPALAASWRPSDDLRTWTFTLRDDAEFHDGNQVTSADVKFSLERIAATGASTLAGARLETLVSIATPSPRDVEITLLAPNAALPELLSSPAFGIARKDATDFDPPVGSGPLAYESADDGIITLLPAAGARLTVDRVELHTYDDLADALPAFDDGALDWTLVPSEESSAGESVPFHAELFYGFNLLDPTFADVRFRQAIVQAIDRVAVVRAAYSDAALPLSGVVPRGVPGQVPDPCGPTCGHDDAAAAALVNGLFPDGAVPTVNLDHIVGGVEEEVAVAIERELVAVGIPVARRPRSEDEHAAFIVSGQQGLFRLGWIGLYPSAGAYLDPLFVSSSKDNTTGFASAVVDDVLVRQARSTVDATARAGLYAQAEQAIMAQIPILPLAQFQTRSVAKDRVRGLQVRLDGTFDITAVSLDG